MRESFLSIFSPHQLFASTSPLASRSGGRRRVSTRRLPPRFVTVPSLCPLTLPSPPLPPCFISSVYRRVAARLGDSNRWLWVSSASLERWRGRGEADLSWRRRQAARSRVSHRVDLGQISPGGFVGVALRRCLCRSGQYSASTVSPMSPLTAALVRTSPSCSKLKRRFETHRRRLFFSVMVLRQPPGVSLGFDLFGFRLDWSFVPLLRFV